MIVIRRGAHLYEWEPGKSFRRHIECADLAPSSDGGCACPPPEDDAA